MDLNSTQDIIHAFSKAQELYKAFGTGEESTNTNDQFNQMFQMMELMSNLNQSKSVPTDETANEQKTSYNPQYYDELIHTPTMRSIQSAIPYLKPEYQRNIVIFMKILELKKMLEIYSNRLVTLQSQDIGDWRKNMLLAIRPHMNEDKQQKVDLLIKLIDVRQFMDIINSNSQNQMKN